MAIAIYRKAYLGRAVVDLGSKGGFIASSKLAVLLMMMGSLMVGSVAGPIAGYYLFTAPRMAAGKELLSPYPSSGLVLGKLGDGMISESGVLAAGPEVNDELDFRRPENWFPGVLTPITKKSSITNYSLSISKLGIENATVTIGGNDLFKTLIHYPGTTNPGGLGTAVVFGHSVLRQFYNPKNYRAIFSTIMTLEAGDEIQINYDGVRYVYRVVEKLEVKPTNVEILEQRYDGRYLHLITCVPEGTKLRRGVIVAELVR